VCRNSQCLGAIDLGPPKWIGEGELDENAQGEIVLDVPGVDLAGDRPALDLLQRRTHF